MGENDDVIEYNKNIKIIYLKKCQLVKIRLVKTKREQSRRGVWLVLSWVDANEEGVTPALGVPGTLEGKHGFSTSLLRESQRNHPFFSQMAGWACLFSSSKCPFLQFVIWRMLCSSIHFSKPTVLFSLNIQRSFLNTNPFPLHIGPMEGLEHKLYMSEDSANLRNLSQHALVSPNLTEVFLLLSCCTTIFSMSKAECTKKNTGFAS